MNNYGSHLQFTILNLNLDHAHLSAKEAKIIISTTREGYSIREQLPSTSLKLIIPGILLKTD